MAYSFRHVPEQFARMLAKIGHSYAVVTFGLDTFTPLAVETILGQTKNFPMSLAAALTSNLPSQMLATLSAPKLSPTERRL